MAGLSGAGTPASSVFGACDFIRDKLRFIFINHHIALSWKFSFVYSYSGELSF